MAYAPPQRPSILHRPIKGQSQATTETFDTQFEREQQYWAGKQQRSQQTQDRLLRSLYPTSQDKLEVADELRVSMEHHARAKELQRLQEQAQQEVWARPSSARSNGAPPPDGRPWQATTYTTFNSKEEEDLARRRVASQVALDNRIMIQQNAARKVHEEAEERQVARMTVMDESSFWNLGSTNDRWLPPERRRSPRGDPHAQPGVPAHMRAPYAPYEPSDAALGYQGSAQMLQVASQPPSPEVGGPLGQGGGAYGVQGNRPGTAASGYAGSAYDAARPAAGVATGGVTGSRGGSSAPIWAWDEAAPAQAPHRQRGAGPGGSGGPTPAPWATDVDVRPPSRQPAGAGGGPYEQPGPYGAMGRVTEQLYAAPEHAAPYAYSELGQGQEYPYAPEAVAVEGYDYTGQGQGQGHGRVTDRGLVAEAPASHAQRFSSRPASKPCPFATDLDTPAQRPPSQHQHQQHQHQQPPALLESSGPYQGQQQGQRGGPELLQVQEQALGLPEEGAWAYADPGAMPPPAQQAWGAQALPQAQEQQAWGALPSQRYGSRPPPQPRPYAYDASAGYEPTLSNAQVPPGSATGLRPPSSGGAQASATNRFASRPEPKPCPFATDAVAPGGQQRWAPPAGQLQPQRSFPWL